MKTFVKLLIALIVILSFIFYSLNSNNKTNSSSTDLYHGGETVDGYTLPPMPNPTENDKTLLGIDTNSNGIRDDVEIYIYNRFQGYTNSKVEREIAMQWAKAAQQFLISPETAYEDKKYELIDRAVSCEYYCYTTYLKDVSLEEFNNYTNKHKVFNSKFKDVIYNTKERYKAYFIYNISLSSRVIEIPIITKENCDFDPDPLIEGTL
ncbi:MAG: hypothetical protein LBC08_05330 [Campylobacteraceae bacterium]|jgi:hypothetical protein|nr:hypothetical protein [Campylobacteraceae bacterium]